MKFAAALSCLALAACHAPQTHEQRNFADPAVGEALSEPLMSDVDMRGAAASDALRPADQPATMQIPGDAMVETDGAPTLGQVATARIKQPGFSGCDPTVAYSAQWSLRLPTWLDLPPRARLAEAAGSDTPTCKLRIIRFGVTGTPTETLRHYAVLGKRAGFLVRPGKTSIIATRASDGAAFHIHATAISDGTRIDQTSNRGR
ncbi:MAG: hypothetical protein JWL66_2906 [Sphingomonadales bacterium]|nr:hypothetical protein [Sphingomonadales bacterium]